MLILGNMWNLMITWRRKRRGRGKHIKNGSITNVRLKRKSKQRNINRVPSHILSHQICPIKTIIICFNWPIPSQKNKTKTHELRLSRHRTCVISVSLNGGITMIIKCSKHPFALFSFEGLLDFNTACGQILDKIMEYSSNSEPLSSKIRGGK